MCKRSIILTCLSIVVFGAFLVSCASVPTASESNFKTPVVKLNFVEVAHYWGWWYYSKKIEPTKGEAGDYGAPLDLAFVFNIENPNPYPVKMDSLSFTVAFEEFDLNTVSSMETQWIPAGKTNQVRVHAMFDGRQSLLSLLVTGGFKLQEKGMGSGAGGALQQLETWWKGIPNFSFPVYVKGGSAIFEADGFTKVASFAATYPSAP